MHRPACGPIRPVVFILSMPITAESKCFSSAAPIETFPRATSVRSSKNLSAFSRQNSRKNPGLFPSARLGTSFVFALVVIRFGVHIPDVPLVATARDDIVYGGHRRQHGVVLVVVLVHAVAANQIQIRNRINVVAHFLEAIVDTEICG